MEWTQFIHEALVDRIASDRRHMKKRLGYEPTDEAIREAVDTHDDAIDWLVEQLDHYESEVWDDLERKCEGHPAGPSDPIGQTVYCDGSCK